MGRKDSPKAAHRRGTDSGDSRRDGEFDPRYVWVKSTHGTDVKLRTEISATSVTPLVIAFMWARAQSIASGLLSRGGETRGKSLMSCVHLDVTLLNLFLHHELQ